MGQEKFWSKAGPVQATSAGTTQGRISVISTFGFKVKMRVFLSYLPAQSGLFEVKKVVNETEIDLGPIGGKISERSDLTGYLTGSILYSAPEPRNSIPLQDIDRATYEEEPTIGRRVSPVDPWGNLITKNNPFPVDGRELSVIANIQTLSLMISQGDTPAIFETDSLVRVGDEFVSIGTGSLVRSA